MASDRKTNEAAFKKKNIQKCRTIEAHSPHLSTLERYCFNYLQILSTSPVFSSVLFFAAGNSETRSPWRSPRASTWMPEWPRFITFDLSETGVPAPERCVVPRCSPDVWIDYLLLKTGETWQGRSPKREQNKESDFTDPLSIKHLRSTIRLALPTGIPAASKGNVWGIFPRF